MICNINLLKCWITLKNTFIQLWYFGRFSLLFCILIPFCALFRIIVALRRTSYRYGLLSITRMDIPVIVVGNISVGGTGKTPLVIWLAHFLKQQGYHPGIVSRGYGGKGAISPCCVNPDSNPLRVGEEPVLIARQTGCPVVVDPNRVSAARYLRVNYPACNIILCDDGLQHYALDRNVEIIVIDGERRFGNGWCLPAGPLREPMRRLKTVDFVVANGAAQSGEYGMKLVPTDFYNLNNVAETQSAAYFRNKTIHAVAGIGNPQRFFKMLHNDLGLQIVEHAFPDHHIFTARDLDFGKDAVIIMTEKDAVKCKNFNLQNAWYISVTAELPSEFGDAILNAINR